MAAAERLTEAGPALPTESTHVAPVQSTPAHQDKPLLGIIVIVAGIFALPGMDAIAKSLSGHLPVIELVWARYLFYALAMLPVALRRQSRALLRPTRPGLQVLRGAIMAFSAWMFFAAVSRMPLADAMAVFFIYPFLILIGSALLLRESVGLLRWLMVILGFIGAALVIRPAIGTISPGVPFALASGFAYAGSMLVTRKLGAHDPAIVTSAISAVLGAVVYSLVMPFVWVTPAWSDWPLMALMGIIAAIGHFMIVHAHRLAPASQLAPFGYIEIVSAIVIGLVVFGDIPAPIVWLGIALIVISGIVATRLRR